MPFSISTQLWVRVGGSAQGACRRDLEWPMEKLNGFSWIHSRHTRPDKKVFHLKESSHPIWKCSSSRQEDGNWGKHFGDGCKRGGFLVMAVKFGWVETWWGFRYCLVPEKGHRNPSPPCPPPTTFHPHPRASVSTLLRVWMGKTVGTYTEISVKKDWFWVT